MYLTQHERYWEHFHMFLSSFLFPPILCLVSACMYFVCIEKCTPIIGSWHGLQHIPIDLQQQRHKEKKKKRKKVHKELFTWSRHHYLSSWSWVCFLLSKRNISLYFNHYASYIHNHFQFFLKDIWTTSLDIVILYWGKKKWKN